MSFGKRVISRLDIKAPNLIKGIHLEGFRVLGDPVRFSSDYCKQGIDELIYMDVVASLYGRSSIVNLIKNIANEIFIPLTVGGGIRSLQDVEVMLHAGADKVAVNTAAVKNPNLIAEIAKQFGSQCLVLSIEAKSTGNESWEVYTENGREKTGRGVFEWCQQVTSLGAGEILLTSIDREGTRKGFELGLIEKIATSVNIPVIASGGCGNCNDVVAAFQQGQADAVAVADILHYQRANINDIKKAMRTAKIPVRNSESHLCQT